MPPLPRSFFARPTIEVARDLLGLVLRHESPEGPAAGRIVEVEAYLGRDDPASHAYRGPTPRARIMYGPPGHAYVYLSYGVNHCVNVVCEPDGTAGAVLLRALEPVLGLDLMARRRGCTDPRGFCSGPGKLARALGIDLARNGADLTRPPLSVEDGRLALAPARIETSGRVGLRVAADRPLRFVEAGSRFLSRGPGFGRAGPKTSGRGSPSPGPRA